MKKLTVQVPVELHSTLKAMAVMLDTSMRSLIVDDMQSRAKFFRKYLDYSRSFEKDGKVDPSAYDELRAFIFEDMRGRTQFFHNLVSLSAEKGLSGVIDDCFTSEGE